MEQSQTMKEKRKTLITVLDICDSILPPRKTGNVSKEEKALRISLLYAIGKHFDLEEDFINNYYKRAHDQRYLIMKKTKENELKDEKKVESNEEQQHRLVIDKCVQQYSAQLLKIKKSKEEVARASQRSTKKLAPARLPPTKSTAPTKKLAPPKTKQPPKSNVPSKSNAPSKAQLSDGEKKAEKTAKEDSSEDELDKELKEAERKAKEVDRETKRVDLQLILAEKSLEVTAWKIFSHFGKVYLENDPPEYSYDPEVSKQYSEYPKL
uniref:Uncharacterized protein n=1 Tax=Panagrolaimus davidi TaxID=227884 RepID=A0A914QY25_9BILA